jgi:tryptophan-rich sensory protein
MRASVPNDIGALAIEGVNGVISSHVRRVALALGARVPDAIWLALYALTAIAMMIVGHHGGAKGDRQPFGMVALSIAFALVILLIDALDRPRESLLGVSQRPLVELRAWMDSTRAP